MMKLIIEIGNKKVVTGIYTIGERITKKGRRLGNILKAYDEKGYLIDTCTLPSKVMNFFVKYSDLDIKYVFGDDSIYDGEEFPVYLDV